MPNKKYELDTDISGRRVFLAFLVGSGIGTAMVYPTLPKGVRVVELEPQTVSVGPVGGPLLIGVALFLFFFLGMFLLNMIFIEASR